MNALNWLAVFIKLHRKLKVIFVDYENVLFKIFRITSDFCNSDGG